MKNNRLGVVLCLVLLLGVNSLTPKVYAGDIPPALVNAKAQFYNFLRTFVQGEGGMAAQQNIVLNSTILPLDLATDTPFYNHELFRAYADRTFSGGLEGIQASSAAFFSERFSSQYRALMNIVTAQIDQNHPEIEHSLEDLRRPGLHWQMNVLAHRVDFRHCRDHSLAEVVRVRAREAQPANAVDTADRAQEVREIELAIVIRIDSLAE